METCTGDDIWVPTALELTWIETRKRHATIVCLVRKQNDCIEKEYFVCLVLYPLRARTLAIVDLAIVDLEDV